MKSSTESTAFAGQETPAPGEIRESALALIKARDPGALRGLFDEVNPRLARTLAAQRVYGAEAEDLIHQAWQTFFETLDRFEGRSRASTYLTGILVNKLRERRRNSRRMVLEESADDVHDSAFTHDGWWRTEPPDPYRLMRTRELSRRLSDCLEGLGENQRAAFLMVESEERESDEVCNVLGVTATHLRVLVFRAKQKLRACLEGAATAP